MKNEVKKKMHAAKRLLVYQSHRETSVDRKSERHSIQTGREQAITGDEEAAAARRDMSIASGPSESSSNAAIPQKFIVFEHRASIMTVAKPSREHDQWRLSMMLSSFPDVVRQWENFRAVSPT